MNLLPQTRSEFFLIPRSGYFVFEFVLVFEVAFELTVVTMAKL